MTFDRAGDEGLSKNERREAAREKARVLRIQQKKKDRRSKFILQGSLIVVVLAIIAVVGVIIVNSVRPPSPGPLNMLSDGIKIGQNLTADKTPALQPKAKPVASKANTGDVIDIQVYVDYQCPVCGEFESTNAAQIKTLVDSGAATEEIHPIAILDNQSLGKKYSTRAANAAACVANFSPNSFFDFNRQLFRNQPKENTEGLADGKLMDLAKKSKAANQSSISKCITDQRFKSWVAAATTRAASGPIPNSDVAKVAATPTVIINGTKYEGRVNSAKDFATAISKAAGESFVEDPTATPTPSPTPTP